MAASTRMLAFRGTKGVWLVNGPPFSCEEVYHGEIQSFCRCITFSKDGSLFAWSDDESVRIVRLPGFEDLQTIQKPKVSGLYFSPRASILVTIEAYGVKKNSDPNEPNLALWDVQTGEMLKGFLHKKQAYWKPQWTVDDAIMSRLVKNDVNFYEGKNFNVPKVKLHLEKISECSMPECASACHIAVCVPGSKGQPSFVRVYKYPYFSGSPVANKSFFKADKVSLHWNKAGSALLVMTSVESSDQSYYGEQGLHYVSIKGDSCMVPRPKNGPVYHVDWNPKSMQFCVVYGFMPAKTTLYNLKCEPVFDFGTGPRNTAFYNPQGTILCLAGFGNLQGNLEFWDLKQNKLINKFKAMDTTCFEWSQDGEHFLTATMAPRLRVGNGFKVCHYAGRVLHQENFGDNQELWEAAWQPAPPGTYPQKPIVYKTEQSPISSPAEAKPAAAYRPPHVRHLPITVSKFHEYEPPSNAKQSATRDASKKVSRSKKKRDAKVKAQHEALDAVEEWEDPTISSATSIPLPTTTPSTDTGNDKRLRNLMKKLNQIEKLKTDKKSGKKLELHQLEKIKKEKEIRKELEKLKIDS